MTAFNPGQSPPPVSIPIRIAATSCFSSILPRVRTPGVTSMDQPTPDRPTPEPSAPERNPEIAVAPTRTRDERRAARLQTLVGADENVIAWTRGWVSRERRLPR